MEFASSLPGSLLLSVKKKWISRKHHQRKHPFKPLIFSSSIDAANIPSISSISISFLYAPSLYSLFPRCQTETPLPHPLLCENQAERACNISRTRSHRSFVRTRWAPVIVPRLYKVYRGPFGRQKSIRSFVDHG